MLRKPIMLGTTWPTILVSLGKEAASNTNVSRLFCSKYRLQKGRSRSTLCNDVCYSKNKNNDVALCFWLTLDHNSRRGFSTKFYVGRLRAEVQPLNPFIYVPFLTDKIPFPILSIDKWCPFQHTSFRTLHPFFECYKCTLLNRKEENHETRTFSRVFNICNPCLRLNVRFLMKAVLFYL